MNNRGQGSFEYLLILSGVILVLVMILVVVQGQFSASSESFGQNVEHGQQVSCDSNTANE
ncbi:MAG: class III signal peptide-containing protein, partial [Candidatus Micrarchaeia archaeon]